MNYQATARSSFFKVKDVQALKDALEEADVTIIEKDGLVAIISNNENGWCSVPIESEDEDGEAPVPDVAANFVAAGWVAIFMEAGHEDGRYIVGQARAFDLKGNEIVVDLDDIYDKAAKLGKYTNASY